MDKQMPGQADWLDSSSDVYKSRHQTTDHAADEEHTAAFAAAAAAAAPVLPQISRKALLFELHKRIILLIAFSSSSDQQ
jgi:hypothetical protein